MKSKTILLIKEPLLVSWGRDLFTFGWLLGGQYLNYKYLGNSLTITTTLCIAMFVFALGKKSDHLYTVDEAIEKLNAIRKGVTP